MFVSCVNCAKVFACVIVQKCLCDCVEVLIVSLCDCVEVLIVSLCDCVEVLIVSLCDCVEVF